MKERADLRLDVTRYAALAAALAAGERPREVLLGEHGLDEEAWSALDEAWQERLSRALDEEGEGVPPLVAAYAAAFERAARAGRAGVLPFERFAEATREIQRRGDAAAALARVGVSLADFLAANEHWTRRMIAEPELLARFQRVLGG